jgi:hypothetical protein
MWYSGCLIINFFHKGGVMLNTKRFAFLLAIIVTLTINGCATVPLASMHSETKAKTFVVNPDKSNIYLYRNELYGSAIPMTVALDGKVAGQTGPKTFMLWEVAPGSHEIKSSAENVSVLKIDTSPGNNYYVWQEVKMGWAFA